MIRIKYDSMPVRLLVRSDAELRLVVVKWPRGEKPMVLLTTLDAVRMRKALWFELPGTAKVMKTARGLARVW